MNKRGLAPIMILLIAFVVGAILLGSGQIDTGSLSGTNTISLSQANLQSSNQFLSGKVWILTFSAGGLGQSYYGNFNPSDVQQATPDSSTTTKDFSINVDYADEIWNYPIQQTSLNKPIYDIQSKTWSCISIPSESNIKSKTGFSNILWSGAIGLNCFAVGYSSQSPVGDIQNPTLVSSYTIKITTPSGTASKTLDINAGSSQGTIGDYAYVSWLGNLGSGLTFPSQTGYKTAYVNGRWRVISSSSYNNYISQLNSVPPVSSKSAYDAWVVKLQNSVNSAKVSRSFGTLNSETSLDKAIIKITSTTPIQFPVTTLYIKASEIGINTPVPDFRIESSNSQCFKTGEQGAISVIIKNYGESGTGNIYAKCDSPFQVTQNIQVSLNKDESRTILLPLSASADKKIIGSCTIYIESPGGTKSSNAKTCVDPQITCEADKKFCGISGTSEVIRQCSSNGATSSIIQTCTTGQTCIFEQGNPKCVEDGGNLTLLDKIRSFFRNLFGGILDSLKILKIVIIVVLFFIAYIYVLRPILKSLPKVGRFMP